MKENGFTVKYTRSKWYPTDTFTDTDDIDEQELFTSTPDKAES